MTMYTSLNLNKALKEAGCELESEMKWVGNKLKNADVDGYRNNWADDIYPAYDILWDICVRFPIEFFGQKYILETINTINSFNNLPTQLKTIAYEYYPERILRMLQQNKPQKEIEDYIRENTIFNKKNKKGK